MKHICKKLLMVSLVASIGAIYSGLTLAAPIIESLDVEVIFGPGLGEIGSVTVEYEETLIIGTGTESISNPDFALTLDLFGQIFTNSDDVDFPGLPSVIFFDGVIELVDFIIAEASFGPDNPTDIVDPRIGGIAAGIVVDSVVQIETGPPNDVPAPATLALVGLGLAGLGWKRRKAA